MRTAGGAQIIRQALSGGLVDGLTVIVTPVAPGAGQRLFEGFAASVELEHLGVCHPPCATVIDYRVKR